MSVPPKAMHPVSTQTPPKKSAKRPIPPSRARNETPRRAKAAPTATATPKANCHGAHRPPTQKAAVAPRTTARGKTNTIRSHTARAGHNDKHRVRRVSNIRHAFFHVSLTRL